MRLVWTLRIMLYAQVVLGLIRFDALMRGEASNRIISEAHMTLGIVIAILALIVFSPRPTVPGTTLRMLAAVMPLAPLLVGLGFRFGGIGGPVLVGVHILLGLATVALAEMAAGRQRRAMLNT